MSSLEKCLFRSSEVLTSERGTDTALAQRVQKIKPMGCFRYKIVLNRCYFRAL